MDTQSTTTTHTDQPASAATHGQARLAKLTGNRKLFLSLGGLAITALLLSSCHASWHYWADLPGCGTVC